jgi:hypothetical protein
MPAPRHIVDSLECVLTIYFSNCRHKERAAFILCDELAEVTCRERVKQQIPIQSKERGRDSRHECPGTPFVVRLDRATRQCPLPLPQSAVALALATRKAAVHAIPAWIFRHTPKNLCLQDRRAS